MNKKIERPDKKAGEIGQIGQIGEIDRAGCDRKGDLISFLYEEMSDEENREFSRHLTECALCADEVAGFRRVREDLGAWETGWVPRTEVVRPAGLPASLLDKLSSLLLLFPVWARGMALTALAAGLLLALLPMGRGDERVSPDEIDRLVREAVARERQQLENDYRARTVAFEEQSQREHDARIEAVAASCKANLNDLRRSLRAEMRHGQSIRSYFALGDGYDLPGRGAGEER